MSEEMSVAQIKREIMILILILIKNSSSNEITPAEVSAWQYLKKLRKRHM